MRESFFQLCLYLSIGMILFCLVFALLVGINVSNGGYLFGNTKTDTGVEVDVVNKTESFESITGKELTDSMLLVGGTAGILGAIGGGLLGWLTHSSSPIGVGIFTGVFWGSYLSTSEIITNIGFLNDIGFTVIIHVIVALLFVGAIIGMLSGSG